jgi:hypothetical protein
VRVSRDCSSDLSRNLPQNCDPQNAQHSSHPQSSMNKLFVNTQRSQRVRFTLFTKILFKELQQLDDQSMYIAAQSIVKETIQRHRSRELRSPPFFQVVENQLRDLVGEVRWRRAHKLMRFYLTKNNEILLLPTTHHVRIGSHAA